jgi:hypothetical protein
MTLRITGHTRGWGCILNHPKYLDDGVDVAD